MGRLCGDKPKTSLAANRTRESRPSGMRGGLAETWAMVELGYPPRRSKERESETLCLRSYAPHFYPTALHGCCCLPWRVWPDTLLEIAPYFHRRWRALAHELLLAKSWITLRAQRSAKSALLLGPSSKQSHNPIEVYRCRS